MDCTVLEGHRGKEKQNAAYHGKPQRSHLKWPLSTHNKIPSRGVDVAPYPIDWDDLQRFHFFAGIVWAKADQLGLKTRWGGDWNRNLQVKDERFRDLVHWEILL